ncbi:ubiquitin carboxyl-terminal hydrolase [Perkinsus chesapeaki]|uniref:Ubiquitin carboxyl-terminal hydrolase n=1 Tax=Perkinsus chesapeaki TaxID=330153 RepID=A0A7J6MZL4_PERCH|nr:ubiquitin carboxyl-terminal hydrolase [Perkinsus chesapeaki]
MDETYHRTPLGLLRLWTEVPSSMPQAPEGMLKLLLSWMDLPDPTHRIASMAFALLMRIKKEFPNTLTFDCYLLADYLSMVPKANPQTQACLFLLRPETLPVTVQALLLASEAQQPAEDMMALWVKLISVPAMPPPKYVVSGAVNMERWGTAYPIYSLVTTYFRSVIRQCYADKASSSMSDGGADWRAVCESMLRTLSAKLHDSTTAVDGLRQLLMILKPAGPFKNGAGHGQGSILLHGAVAQIFDASLLPYYERIRTLWESGQVESPSPYALTLIGELIDLIRPYVGDMTPSYTNGQITTAAMLGLPPVAAKITSGPAGMNSAAAVAAVPPPPMPSGPLPTTNWLLPVVGDFAAGPPIQQQQQIVPQEPQKQELVYVTGSNGETVKFRKHTVGIQNYNNTCYLGVFLQMLFLTDAFCSSVYGFQLQETDDLKGDDYDEGKKILDGLRLLFARMLLTPYAYVEISDFINILPPSFRTGQEQDATESARWILDKLGGTQQRLVGDIFGLELVHKTECETCHTVSTRSEKCTDVGLSVPREAEALVMGGTLDVNALINMWLEPEMMNGNNQYSCDKCGCKRDAKRWVELKSRAPTHLILVLYRFSFDIDSCDFKKEKTVVYPNMDDLNFGGAQYECYGSILHKGETIQNGHYITVGRRSEATRGKWHEYNDSEVTAISKDEVNRLLSGLERPNTSAYMLFYHMKGPNVPRGPMPVMDPKITAEARDIESKAVHLND